jgi:hypothetical protein
MLKPVHEPGEIERQGREHDQQPILVMFPDQNIQHGAEIGDDQ